MKSQVAAEIAAAAALARSGWRPARGELLIVAVVDEETGGALGAQWITENHPEKVRCDLLVNEGGGAVFEYGAGRRCYGVCCAEKGVFRFTRHHRRGGRPRVDARHGRERAAEDGAGARALRGAPALLPADGRAAGVPARDRRGPRGPGGRDRAPARGRPAPGDHVRADARRHVHADADHRLGEDQRDPQPRRAEGRLPRAAGAGRGGGARGYRRGAGTAHPAARTAAAGGSSSPSGSSATARRSRRS